MRTLGGVSTAILLVGMQACGLPLFTARPVPPVTWPSRTVLAGAIREIRQEHTACFGFCPVYTVALRRDGTADYHGKAHVPMLGSYTATVDSVTFQQLATFLVRKGFFRLAPYYGVGATDQASTVTTATFDGDSAVVSRYGWTGPYDLGDIEDAIDSVASVLKWTAQP